MALADLQQVFNTIQQQQEGARQQQQITNQAAQAKAAEAQRQRALDLEQTRLEHEHEYQNLLLQTQQSLQRHQALMQYAQDPDAARAIGQITGNIYGRPMPAPDASSGYPGGPTMQFAQQGPTEQQISIPSEIPGGQPYNLTLPTPTEQARRAAEYTSIAQAPAWAQAQKLLDDKNATAEQIAEVRRQAMEMVQNERGASATHIAEINNQRARDIDNANNMTKMLLLSMNPMKQVDANKVNDWNTRIYNGDVTDKEFNSTKELDPYEKLSVGNAGAHPITEKQKAALVSLGQLTPFLNSARDLAVQLDKDPTGKTPESKRLLEQVKSGFGSYAGQMSSVSSGRLSNIEAGNVLGAVQPDIPLFTSPFASGQTSDANVKKYNNVIGQVLNHINKTLADVPADRRQAMINKYLGDFNTTRYNNIAHMTADVYHQPYNAPSSPGRGGANANLPKVNNIDDYNRLAPNTKYIDPNGKVKVKGQ